MSQLADFWDRIKDRERAAAELHELQLEAIDRPRLYRIMYVPPRQPQDVEMSHCLSQWLCEYFTRENSA